MKKLSIEQKAQRYDEALKKAKDFYKGYKQRDNQLYADDLESIFPELKESEDERMVKFIKKQLFNIKKTITENYELDAKLTKAIDWLEKQVGQKPAVIIPKFRVGDEIKTSNEESLTITKIDEKGYWSEDLFICGFDDAYNWKLVEQKPADKVESKFHEGDWVIDKQGIVHQISNVIENVTNHTYSYDIVGGGYFNDNTEGVRLWTIQDAKDGDVLAAKTTIGYPNPFIAIYKEHGLNFFNSHCFVSWDGEFHEGTTGHSISNIHPATKEQCDFLFQKMKEAGYEWDDEKKELKKIEKKSVECSEDDLPEFESYLCLMFQKFRTKGICTNGEIIDYVNEHSQKLKDILCHAWSEEDNKNLEKTVWYVEQGGKLIFKKTDKLMSWLKSLKDRYTWKPSERQKEALLWCVVHLGGADKQTLGELLEELNKL